MKKLAVLIDGGHLRALANRHYKKLNKDFRYNRFAPDLVEEFVAGAIGVDEEVTRIFYYDCPPYVGKQTLPISGKTYAPTPSAKWLYDLAERDRIAVRLGSMKWRGWKLALEDDGSYPAGPLSDKHFAPDTQQKGVDTKIALDISHFANHRIVDRLMLFTGDIDFIPALKLARKAGIQVVIPNIPGCRPDSVAFKELLRNADVHRKMEWPTLAALGVAGADRVTLASSAQVDGHVLGTAGKATSQAGEESTIDVSAAVEPSQVSEPTKAADPQKRTH